MYEYHYELAPEWQYSVKNHSTVATHICHAHIESVWGADAVLKKS